MRRLAAVLTLASLCGCAASAGKLAPTAPELRETLGALPLRNADFEAPLRAQNHCADRWDCSVHADPASYTFRLDTAKPSQGAHSLCIERVGKEPWATVTQAVRDAGGLAGKRLRLSMALRLEGVTGEGAGPWVQLHGPGGRNLKHDQKLFKGTRGWEREVLEFTVLAGTEIVEIGATLEGPGRLCIDEVRLETLDVR